MDNPSLAFSKSLLSGVWEAGVGMVKGLGQLAVNGYQIATDEKARESAWNATQEIVADAEIYGEAIIDDPTKLYRDARDGTLAVYENFEQAKALAEKEGRLAEFYGEMTGKAIFEVGTILIPVGKLAKAGKLGKAAETADDIADIGKKVETAEDILSPAQKAQNTMDHPLSRELDEPLSAIQQCPVRKCDKINGGKNTNPNDLKSRDVDKPTKGEGGVYQFEKDGKTKTGSTGDFHDRYGGQKIEKEFPQTRKKRADGVDDTDYPWSPRRQRRFDEEYIDRTVPKDDRYRAPGNPRKPVSSEKWKNHKDTFGYGDVPDDFGN